MTKLLLCTDMDRTVIPNGMQQEATDARKKFTEFCALSAVTLVYVTGRHLDLMQQAINEFQLPQPNYAITDVGTRIYKQINGQWQLLKEWETDIDHEWLMVNPIQIHELLLSIKGLTLQEPEKQNSHKISFYVDLEQLDEAHCLASVRERLAPQNMQTNLIWSIDETSNTGLLDLLPPRANKLHAIEFLQKYLNFGKRELVFAGDSGNDLQVLISPIQSVLVANATDDLKQQANQLAQQQGTELQFYQAKNDANYSGNYSSGVLQGVFHYIPEFKINTQ